VGKPLDTSLLVKEVKVNIVWVVSSLTGLRDVLDASTDVFYTYSEALQESKNRGPGWVPLVLEPQRVIMGLLDENHRLQVENERLRRAVEWDKSE
jgi:hypothetical protein